MKVNKKYSDWAERYNVQRSQVEIKVMIEDAQTLSTCPDCARLTKELEEAKTSLDAWQNIFGTSQLTHAWARLESAEESYARLKALLQAAQELIHTPSGNPFEYKLKYDALEARIKKEGIE